MVHSQTKNQESKTRFSTVPSVALAGSLAAMLSIPFLPFVQGKPASAISTAAPGKIPEKAPQSPAGKPGATPAPAPTGDKQQPSAQTLADYGSYQLDWDLPDKAIEECQAALSKDPANKTAVKCLEDAAALKADDALNGAAGQILNHNTSQAAATASSWVFSHACIDQRIRAWQILTEAQKITLYKIWQGIPIWLREALITIAVILACALLACLVRWAWNYLLGLRKRTVWRLMPLKEISPSTDGDKATDDFLDALSRLGDELDRDLSAPPLLLLRPTPPATFMPSLITNFLSNAATPKLELFPDIEDLGDQWRLRSFQLDDAIKDLQLKTTAGIDVGAIIRFLIALGQWISSGSPTITGSVERVPAVPPAPSATVPAPPVPPAPAPVAAPAPAPPAAPPAPPVSPTVAALAGNPQEAAIHVAGRGVGVETVSITTSSEIGAGVDCIQLIAARAAFKFLLRVEFQAMTNDAVDGIAALRQGAVLFLQFAGTSAGVGTSATTRISSLRASARNLGFFRTAIPVSH